MGFAVHITRASRWMSSEETPIALDEWRAVVAADPSLEPDADDETAADWNGHSDQAKRPSFRWTAGRIVVDRPDDCTVHKAQELAGVLRSAVIDDDGEVRREQRPARSPAVRSALKDRQELVRHALNRGWFHGGWVCRGILLRRVRLTVHTVDGSHHFLIVVHHPGPLRDVDDRTRVDVLPLTPDTVVEPNRFLGRTVGFRMRSSEGVEVAVRVREPGTWIRWLQHPDQPVTLAVT
ncbi:MAG: hypothetical protein JXB32_09895 [Deltaproteobacteria bacterium]|nr:hypothetical protein [Deltaproteobacteria bacterium]